MNSTVTIDPRLHDAVIFDLDSAAVFGSMGALVRKLRETGVATGVYSSSPNCEQILKDAGLDGMFAVRVDGVMADSLGLPRKPNPAVQLEVVNRLGAAPERSVV